MSTDDIAAMTYEQALAELDTLITRLEGGAVELDEAIACYERGSHLAQRCAELLDRTEQAVAQLVVGAQGRIEERPLPANQPQTPPNDGGAGAPGARQVRARAAAAPPPPPGMLPGLGPEPSRRGEPVPIDPDDIPF
jgi:exodeoxyribonuclease VII small subunit